VVRLQDGDPSPRQRYFLDRIEDEFEELRGAVRWAIREGTVANRMALVEECADLANFAMMLADTARGLIEEDLNAEADVQEDGH